jgi:hypothetical protein
MVRRCGVKVAFHFDVRTVLNVVRTEAYLNRGWWTVAGYDESDALDEMEAGCHNAYFYACFRPRFGLRFKKSRFALGYFDGVVLRQMSCVTSVYLQAPLKGEFILVFWSSLHRQPSGRSRRRTLPLKPSPRHTCAGQRTTGNRRASPSRLALTSPLDDVTLISSRFGQVVTASQYAHDQNIVSTSCVHVVTVPSRCGLLSGANDRSKNLSIWFGLAFSPTRSSLAIKPASMSQELWSEAIGIYLVTTQP